MLKSEAVKASKYWLAVRTSKGRPKTKVQKLQLLLSKHLVQDSICKKARVVIDMHAHFLSLIYQCPQIGSKNTPNNVLPGKF